MVSCAERTMSEVRNWTSAGPELVRHLPSFGPMLGRCAGTAFAQRRADVGPMSGQCWADVYKYGVGYNCWASVGIGRCWADVGPILARCRANVGPMSGQCRVDVGPMYTSMDPSRL